MVKRLTFKFGILLDMKDSESWHPVTIKVLMALSWFTTSPTKIHLTISVIGWKKYTCTHQRLQKLFWSAASVISSLTGECHLTLPKHFLRFVVGLTIVHFRYWVSNLLTVLQVPHILRLRPERAKMWTRYFLVFHHQSLAGGSTLKTGSINHLSLTQEMKYKEIVILSRFTRWFAKWNQLDQEDRQKFKIYRGLKHEKILFPLMVQNGRSNLEDAVSAVRSFNIPKFISPDKKWWMKLYLTNSHQVDSAVFISFRYFSFN